MLLLYQFRQLCMAPRRTTAFTMRAIFVLSLLMLISCYGGVTPTKAQGEAWVARVERVQAAEWDHYANGNFDAFSEIILKVVSPSDVSGQTVRVREVPLGDSSSHWTVGSICRFTIPSDRKLGQPYFVSPRELSCGSK